MQEFIDTATQQIWSFEDDVVVDDEGGVYSFTAAHGLPLNAPSTLQPYVAPTLTAAQLAAQKAAANAAALAAQASAALSAGLSIVSSGTPSLNGTYGCDQLSQMDIVAIETGLNAGKGFPGGVSPFSYPDAKGTMRVFSETDFTNFAAAIRDYVYRLKSVISGASSEIPAPSTSIS